MRTEAVHHEIISLPVRGKSRFLPVVVTEHGPLASAVRFLNLPRFDHRSVGLRREVCRSIGLLYDYATAVGAPATLGDRKRFLSDFVLALTQGSAVGSTDESGLRWTPMSWIQIRQIVDHVTAFGDFCCDDDKHPPINPQVDATFRERIAAYIRLDKKNSQSLLRHLGPGKAAFLEASKVREVAGPRPPKVVQSRPPAFPAEHFRRLLDEGFIRPGSKPGDPAWMRWNIRDMMICILQRHGGLRESEPFHLFVNDVKPDPADTASALVFLCHPEISRISYRDPTTGGMVTEARSEFLRSVYGLKPRNVTSGKQHAGWKDLLLDEGAPHWRARVRWYPIEWGRVFKTLFEIYLKHVLPRDLAHPYLLVVLRRGGGYGQPYTLSAYNQNLAAAITRIGLAVSKKDGTTSHGFRHRYGQDLERSKISNKIIMLAMHHKSVQSQEVYTGPELGEVNAVLRAAGERVATAQELSIGVPEDDPRCRLQAVESIEARP